MLLLSKGMRLDVQFFVINDLYFLYEYINLVLNILMFVFGGTAPRWRCPSVVIFIAVSLKIDNVCCLDFSFTYKHVFEASG